MELVQPAYEDTALEKLLGSKLNRTRPQEEEKESPDASEGRAEIKAVSWYMCAIL